jgi:FkbM family methyltransferase
MLVNRHDYRLTDKGGYGVGFQIFNTSSYDPDEVNVVLQLLETRRENFGDGVVAVDCGANIGVHTIEWAKFMHGWGEVVAFEAQERIFYALAGNITLNNCFNARALWAAIGSENGVIRVPRLDYFTPSSFGSLEVRETSNPENIGQKVDYSDAGTQLTSMVTIDGFNFPRLDFLKIDIEGMEMEALKGAEKTIARTHPQILVEKIKSTETDITSFLSQLGYQIFPAGMNLLAIHESDPVAGSLGEV